MNKISQPIMQPGVIEFFAHNGNAYAKIDGKDYEVSEWPTRVASMITRDMDRHPGAEEALERMGLHDAISKINQYTMCMYGELNNTPDFIDFKKTNEVEFCQLICGTKNCKFRGMLCNLIHADYGALTDAEVKVCIALHIEETAQRAADQLGISVHTVDVHISNIMTKIGCRSCKGIVAWTALHLVTPRSPR